MAEILASAGADTDAERVSSAELRARRALHAALDRGVADTEPTVWRDKQNQQLFLLSAGTFLFLL